MTCPHCLVDFHESWYSTVLQWPANYALSDPDGVEFARGLTNYSSSDATKISGLRTEQIGEALGTVPYDEIIHRDNLVVII